MKQSRRSEDDASESCTRSNFGMARSARPGPPPAIGQRAGGRATHHGRENHETSRTCSLSSWRNDSQTAHLVQFLGGGDASTYTKRLEDVDFSAQPGLDRRIVDELGAVPVTSRGSVMGIGPCLGWALSEDQQQGVRRLGTSLRRRRRDGLCRPRPAPAPIHRPPHPRRELSAQREAPGRRARQPAAKRQVCRRELTNTPNSTPAGGSILNA